MLAIIDGMGWPKRLEVAVNLLWGGCFLSWALWRYGRGGSAPGQTPDPPGAGSRPAFAGWPCGGGSSASFSHPPLPPVASASRPAV